MNKLLFAPLAAAVALVAMPAHSANLTVDVEGVRAASGKLFVSVQGRDQFMRNDAAAGTVLSAAAAGAHRFSFDLPAGDYAVSVWHDDNGNGQFDKSESHMPLDGWAMLNGEKLRGEPKFDDVRTAVGVAPAQVRVKMIYGR